MIGIIMLTLQLNKLDWTSLGASDLNDANNCASNHFSIPNAKSSTWKPL